MEQKKVAIWQAVGVGALVGFVTLFIIYILFDFGGAMVLGMYIGMPIGIAGAVMGRQKGNNWSSVFLGSFLAILYIMGFFWCLNSVLF